MKSDIKFESYFKLEQIEKQSYDNIAKKDRLLNMDDTISIQRYSLFMLSIVFHQKKDQASRKTPLNSQLSLEFHVLPLYWSLSPPCALFSNGIVLSRILCYLVATVALEVQCLRKWFFERSITNRSRPRSRNFPCTRRYNWVK